MSILGYLAARNILRHRRYSFGTFIIISVGFLTLALFRAYMADVRWMYEDNYQRRGMLGHVLVERAGTLQDRRQDPWAFNLDESGQQFVEDYLKKNQTQVQGWVRFLHGTGMISQGPVSAVFAARGYDIASGAKMRGATWAWDTAAGKPLHLDGPHKLVIGKGLAATLECSQEHPQEKIFSVRGGYRAEVRPFQCPDRMQLSVTTASGQMNSTFGQVGGFVDGIFREVDSRLVMMSVTEMQALFDTKTISMYAVELADGDDALAFSRHLVDAAQAQGSALKATRWQDHDAGEIYRRTMELLNIFTTFVISIMVVICGLSVFNTFLKAISERTREIGTLRSLGFTNHKIRVLIGLESFFLGLAGLVAGLLVGLAATWAVNHAGIVYKAGILVEPVPLRIAYDGLIYVSSGAFLLTVAVSAALLALLVMLKREIAENLVHV